MQSEISSPVLRPGVTPSRLRIVTPLKDRSGRLRWPHAEGVDEIDVAIDAAGTLDVQPSLPIKTAAGRGIITLVLDDGETHEIVIPVEDHGRETPLEIPTSSGVPTPWWMPQEVPEEDLETPFSYEVPELVPPGIVAQPMAVGLGTTECAQPVYPLDCSSAESFAMGDPVFAHNGEHVQSVLDLAFDNPLGPPVRFVRTYRSQKLGASVIGQGWDHSFNLWLDIDRINRRVTFYSGTGRADTWTGTSAGWMPPRGIYADLELDDAAGTVTLWGRDGSAMVFNATTGLIAEVVEPSGAKLSFAHDAVTGQLIEVRDALWHATRNPDRALRLTYDVTGRVATIEDFVGRRLSYYYYQANEPGGPPGALKCVQLSSPRERDRPTTFYTYDDAFSALASVTRPADVASLGIAPTNVLTPSQRDALVDHASLRLAYDNERRVVSQTVGGRLGSYAFSYGVAANTTAMTDPVGNKTTFEFDGAAPRLVRRHSRGIRAGDPYLPAAEPAAFEIAYTPASADTYEPSITRRSDGTEMVLEYVGSGAPAPRFRGLMRSARNLSDPNAPETRFTYDFDLTLGGARGLLVRLTAGGEETVITYNAIGQPVRVQHPGVEIFDHDGPTGATVESWYELSYDTSGIRERRDSSGQVVRVERFSDAAAAPNHFGRIQTVTINPQSAPADPSATNLRYEYAYTPLGYITSLKEPHGAMRTITYDGFGRPRHQSRARDDTLEIDYDLNGSLSERRRLADGYWWRTRWMHDRAGQAVRIDREVTRNRFLSTTIGYDATGRVVELNEAGRQTRFTYDERGLPYIATAAAGTPDAATYRFFYDSGGRLVRRVAPGGGVDDYDYDRFGRNVGQRDDRGGQVQLRLDDSGLVTSLSVLDNGQLLRRTDLRYDTLGRLVWRDESLLDANGQTVERYRTAVTYGATSGLAERVSKGTPQQVLWRRSLDRDLLGRTVRVTDSDGRRADIKRDAAGRVVEVRTADVVQHLDYDALGRVGGVAIDADGQSRKYRFKYDAWNRRVYSEGPENTRLRIRFDGLGRVVEREEWERDRGSFASNPTLRSTFTWSDIGSLLSATDPSGATTLWSYDALGRVTRELRPDGSSECYGYNDDDSLAWHLRPDGARTDFSYVRSANVVALTFSLPPGQVGSTYARFEMQLGRIVRATNDFADVRRRFDSLGRQIAEAVMFPDGQRMATTAAWSDTGELARLDYPGGAVLDFDRDMNGEWRALSVDGSALLTFTRTSDGGRVYGRGVGITTSVVQDVRGRVLRVSETSAAATFGHEHRYDGAGRRVWTRWLDRDRQDKFAYDLANRVVMHSKQGSDVIAATTTIGYAASGARQFVQYQENVAPFNATTTRFTQTPLHAYASATSRIATTTYDTWLGGARRGDGARTFRYDAAGRLGATVTNTATDSVRRDAFGRPVESGGGTATRRFAHFRDHWIETQSTSGVTLREVFFGDTVDEVHALRTPDGVWYLHRDAQNNVIAASDPGGRVVERYDYDLDGQVTITRAGQPVATSSIGNDLLFRARPQDAASGLVDFRNRHYDPQTASFLTPDPTGIWFDQTARGNGFCAFGGDPINGQDAYGLDAWDRFVGGLQVVGGVLEVAGGVGLLLVPEPTFVTKAGGVVLTGHGIDTLIAGARTLWNGKVTPTATQTVTEQTALQLGASPQTARRTGMVVDFAAGVGPSLTVGITRRLAIRSAEQATVAGGDDAVRILTIGYIDRGLRTPGHVMVGLGRDPDTWRHLVINQSDDGTRLLAWETRAANTLNTQPQLLRLPYAVNRTEHVLETFARLGQEIPGSTYGTFRWNCVTPVAQTLRAARIPVPFTFGIQKSRLLYQGARNGYLIIGAGRTVTAGATSGTQLRDGRETLPAFLGR